MTDGCDCECIPAHCPVHVRVTLDEYQQFSTAIAARDHALDRLRMAERVIEAARAVYEADDFITKARDGDGRDERDQLLGKALAAFDGASREGEAK